MIRTQVYLPEDLHRELKLIANSERVKYSRLIREGLHEVLEKRKRKKATSKKWKAFVGALTYGPKDLSTRISDIYK